MTYQTHPDGARALNHAYRTRFRRHCRPRPKLSMAPWCEQYVHLPSATTKQAGPLRLSIAPYLRPVMEACSDPRTQRVTLIAPSQSAKTTFVIVAVLYFAHQEPAPVLVVEPTLDMAQDFSKGRLTPTIEASPSLRGLIAKARSRDSANTILSKQYPGGQLDMAGANSPAGLASRPKRMVLFDEVDRYPVEAGAEGDPISIGEARTRSYQRSRKIIVVTSPTDEPEKDGDGRWVGSRGWREFLKGTREVWEEACPDCGEYQVLDFFRLKFETVGSGEDAKVPRDSVRYPCVACGYEMTEADRPTMRASGRFTAKASNVDLTHRSFHVEGPSAAFALWDELCQEFVTKANDPALFKTFMNTAIGRTWKDRRVENRTTVLGARALPYDGREADGERLFDVPREVGVLTAGVDVQHDRLEVSLWGWGVGQQAWLISHQVIIGDPTQPAVWQSLDNWRQLRWQHEAGATMSIKAMAVDAGDGNMSGHVYAYCAPRFGTGVFAVKGHGDVGAPLVPKKPTKVKPGRLYMLGVNGLTQRWYLRLDATQPGPGYVHLNHQANDDWIRQLLGMERVIDPKTRKRRWVARKNQRVEAIDCANYALGALLLSTRDEELIGHVQRMHEAGEHAKAAKSPDSASVPVPASKASRTKNWVGRGRGGKWL